MKQYVQRKEMLWTVIMGLCVWNMGLTFRSIPPKVVTLDAAKVIRKAMQQLAEGDTLQESDKDALAQRLRAIVHAYAIKHKTIVVDSSTVIAGPVNDITPLIIEALNK